MLIGCSCDRLTRWRPLAREPRNPGKVLENMWDKLSHADIEHARRQLERRQADMLTRHAKELSALVSDQAEIETLNQLIGAFAEKYKKAATPASELAVRPEEEPTDITAPDLIVRWA